MNHPMSNSSQSIASSSANNLSASLSGLRANGGAGGGGTAAATHYVNGTGSLGRLKYHTKHFNASDEELDYSQLSQSTHLLGRVKSERFLASSTKAVDEDRRRRTIIVEKRRESYGFTLQSYGIHYKRDQEMEMITYVDYVEYDGPAYRAGMREGDVILSINGVDLEKADHKTLVDFIKASDSRMRMVVLFEDCVRKVDLHMRYMQLQNMLQSKMNELERVCLRERELLEGKWKTHSLPARKKAITSPTDNPDAGGVSPTDGTELPYYRPTLSTEDVANMVRHHHQTHQPTTAPIIPPPAQFMLTYHHYLGDPGYGRYVLKPYPANSPGSGEYFVSVGGGGAAGSREGSGSGGLVECDALRRSPLLSHSDSMGADATGSPVGGGQQQRSGSSAAITVSAAAAVQGPPVPPPRTCEKHKPPAAVQKTPEKAQKSGKHCHGHSCNPCIGNFRWKSVDKTMPSAQNGGAMSASAAASNGDNVSLDAYDLASPCCDSHCVPTRRRVRHQHKEHHQHKHKHRDRERDSKERPPRPKSQTHMHQHQHYHAEVQQQQQQHTHTHPHAHPQHALQPHVHVAQQQQHQHTHKQHQHHHQQRQHSQHAGAAEQPAHAHCESRNGSIRSHYYDLNTGMASHCSLYSCTSSELAPVDSTATSYTTSLSTDTLFWDPKSENLSSSRQHSTKSRQSYQQQSPQQQQQQQQQQQHQQQQQQQHQSQSQQHQSQQHQPLPQHQHQHQQQHAQHTHTAGIYQHRYHITATQIQPSQIYPNTGYAAVHKPKSWDNLTAKAIGDYGFGGYGYLDAVAMKPTVKLQIAQQRHSIPRKNPYGRYSTYTDIENYAPPPQQFVEELMTTTTTTMISAKSTEELIAVPIQPQAANICDCLSKQAQQQPQTQSQQFTTAQQPQQLQHNNCQMGYYSHLPRPTIDVGTSTAPPGAPSSQATTVQTTTMTANNGDISTVSEVTRL